MNAVSTDLQKILEEQVSKLKIIASARILDKTEILLLKVCIDLHATKPAEELSSILITSRTIQTDEERADLMALALKN